MTTQTAIRRNDFGTQRTEIMTTPDRRNDAVTQCDGTMTTLCSCGKSFNPRPGQLYHSTRCRKLAYEKSAKARVRRSRYFKTDKGRETQRRYRETGATVKNSREYRERSLIALRQLDSAIRKHGLDNLKPEQVWAEEEIRNLNIYALWQWAGSSSYRVARAKHRLDEFFDKLAEAKAAICRSRSYGRTQEALRQSYSF